MKEPASFGRKIERLSRRIGDYQAALAAVDQRRSLRWRGQDVNEERFQRRQPTSTC
jgi:hypothetical protein